MILSLYIHFLSRKIRGQWGSGLARESKRGVYLLHNTCGRRGTILLFLDLSNLYLCFSPFMSLSLCLRFSLSLSMSLPLCLSLFLPLPLFDWDYVCLFVSVILFVCLHTFVFLSVYRSMIAVCLSFFKNLPFLNSISSFSFFVIHIQCTCGLTFKIVSWCKKI